MPPSLIPGPGKVLSHIEHYEGYSVNVHMLQYQPSDRPIEDRIGVAGGKKLVLGVFDGHGGDWAADYVAQELPKRITSSTEERRVVFEELDRDMIEAFTKTQSWWNFSDPEVAAKRVLAGTTALVAEIGVNEARINHAGDTRAVASAGETVDHDASAASEVHRLQSEHPFEPHIFTRGRLFGQQETTRGLGDAHYKLPLAKHRSHIEAMSRYTKPGIVPRSLMYESLFHDYKTPPYITARPDEMRLSLQGPLVLATDGLWERIASQEALDILRDVPDGVNLAEFLHDEVTRRTGPAGDDVTILVVVPV